MILRALPSPVPTFAFPDERSPRSSPLHRASNGYKMMLQQESDVGRIDLCGASRNRVGHGFDQGNVVEYVPTRIVPREVTGRHAPRCLCQQDPGQKPRNHIGSDLLTYSIGTRGVKVLDPILDFQLSERGLNVPPQRVQLQQH